MSVLILATRNPGKVDEYTTLLDGLPLRVETLAKYPDVPEVEETGSTYFENARTKALVVARACGLPALADDSGLEVDALDGRPGVRSARFSGGGPRENIQRLLDELRSVPRERRHARFRCVIVVAHPDGRTLRTEGVCEGAIGQEPRGSSGFGYDPVFIDRDSGLTFAELPEDTKNGRSHRGRAFAQLRGRLVEFLQSA